MNAVVSLCRKLLRVLLVVVAFVIALPLLLVYCVLLLREDKVLNGDIEY